MSRLRFGAAIPALLIAAPWLSPLAPGPSPNAVPLLTSWICAAAMLLAVSLGSMQIRAATLALALVGVAALGGGAANAAALMALLTVAGCAMAVRASPAASAMSAGVAWGWGLAAGLSCIGALLQYFGWAGEFSGLIAHAEPGEAYANLRQRNQFATLTSLGLIGVLFLRKDSSPPWGVLAVIVLLAFGNAASSSRTGALQWFVVSVLAAVQGRQDNGSTRTWALVGLGSYLAASLLLPALFQQVTGLHAANAFSRMAETPSCGSRLVLWGNVLELSRIRPWSGWGWGELDYAHYAHLYEGERFCDILDNAHNLVLHVAVELGWPAALMLCGFAVWQLVRLRPWSRCGSQASLGWAALAVLLLHSLVEYPLWYGPFQIALGLSLGLVLPSKVEPTPSVRLVERLAFAVVAACSFGWALWDYQRISQLYLPPEDRVAAYRDDTLAKAQRSRIFRDQVRFAELSITPLTRENAAHIHQLALDMLHFSPEPKVIAAAIDSALLLGRDEVALWHMARFKAAFPDDYARWAAERGALPRLP